MMAAFPRSSFLKLCAGMALSLALIPAAQAQRTIELRYGHMNPPNSAAGIQAQMLADEIAKIPTTRSR
jgi:TRAP-type C4-dicarboxylate transport system substrate-binding protein